MSQTVEKEASAKPHEPNGTGSNGKGKNEMTSKAILTLDGCSDDPIREG